MAARPNHYAKAMPIGAPLFSLKPWSDDKVREFISRESGSSFSYPEVGTTASNPPRHYNVDHARIQLGQGSAVWDRAVEAFRAWRMFNMGRTQHSCHEVQSKSPAGAARVPWDRARYRMRYS